MQERHHVKTTPGEPNATPEHVPHPVRREEGGNVQTDDINIPAVAAGVAVFAVLLAVIITSLQAWFYSAEAAEVARKTPAQDDPSTWLGHIVHNQRKELHDVSFHNTDRDLPGATTAPATAESKPRLTIDNAMKLVEKDYAAANPRK